MATLPRCGEFLSSFPIDPFKLGAIPKEEGVEFNLLTGTEATAVQLLLIPNPEDRTNHTVHQMEKVGEGGWHVSVPEAKPGDCYGFRVHGPYEPCQGLMYNPMKVVCDPFGKLIGDPGRNEPQLYVYDPHDRSLVDRCDSLLCCPLSMVPSVDEFEWEGLKFLPTAPQHRVIIEAHVKGLTKCWPGIAPDVQGTYKALSLPTVTDRLKGLGATSLELMPIHQGFKPNSGYWNYNSMCFFAPELSYASSSSPLDVVTELKAAIRELHREGIEVILDVVYNHTVEGNHCGPTLCFRGIGNRSFYLLNPHSQSEYLNRSGVGNTLNSESPLVMLLVLLSLVHWREEYGIDGVRFDLGSLIFQRKTDNWFRFDQDSMLFQLIREYLPKNFFLSTEPWSADNGSDFGAYPDGWSQWNGLYRDACQEVIACGGRNLNKFATRLSGSRDILVDANHAALQQVVYVGSHDGFTLYDRFSYNERRNWDNGEQNRDGHHPDFSWNCGDEGPTAVSGVEALRLAKARLAVALVLASSGTPLITAADLILHSQLGNNNPYGLDNEITWLNWENPRANGFFSFVSGMIALRHRLPALWSYNFTGEGYGWFSPMATVLSIGEWENPNNGVMAVLISGKPAPGVERPEGKDLYLAINFRHQEVEFFFPRHLEDRGTFWSRELDCTLPNPFRHKAVEVTQPCRLGAQGLLIIGAP